MEREHDHAQKPQPHEPETPLLGRESGSDAAPEAEQAEQPTERRKWPWAKQRARVATTRGWSLVFQGLVAFATVVYVVVSFFLWWETRKAVDLTRRSVEATEKAVELSEDSLAETRRSTGLAEAALVTTREHAEIEQGLTREGLEFSQEALRRSERPWVSAEMRKPAQITAEGEPQPIAVTLRNTGGSSAFNVNGAITFQLWPTLPASFPELNPSPESSVSVLAPNTAQDVHRLLMSLSKERVEAIEEGRLRLFVFGEHTYTDNFETKHRIRFCYYRDSHEPYPWVFCRAYNESD